MKHQLKVFNAQGDSAITEWEETDAASMEKAKAVFDQALGEGWAAITPSPSGAVAVGDFSPELGEIFLLRPIAGG